MQHLAPNDNRAARLIQLFMYLHAKPADNAYARPLDFVPVVDLNRRKVPTPEHPVLVDLQWLWRSLSSAALRNQRAYRCEYPFSADIMVDHNFLLISWLITDTLEP
jgi:Copper amine oxidase, N3 domain